MKRGHRYLPTQIHVWNINSRIFCQTKVDTFSTVDKFSMVDKFSTFDNSSAVDISI